MPKKKPTPEEIEMGERLGALRDEVARLLGRPAVRRGVATLSQREIAERSGGFIRSHTTVLRLEHGDGWGSTYNTEGLARAYGVRFETFIESLRGSPGALDIAELAKLSAPSFAQRYSPRLNTSERAASHSKQQVRASSDVDGDANQTHRDEPVPPARGEAVRASGRGSARTAGR